MAVNPVRKAIVAKLAADGTLTSMLASPASPYSAAIYEGTAAQGSKPPYVLVNKQSGTREWSFGGEPLRDEIWQVKAVTLNDPKVAEDIDTRCEDILNGAHLNIDGMIHMYLQRQSDVDYPEPKQGETYRHVGGLYNLTAQRLPS